MESASSAQPPGAPKILIAYDGSPHAERAVDEAARMFPGATAVLVTAWTSIREAARAGRAALPESVVQQAVHEIDAATEAEAQAKANAGAERAQTQGLAATALAIQADGSVASAILDAAGEHHATAVVVGSRGLSGVRSALLGSVSNAIVHHSARPVVVVHGDPETLPGR